MRILADENIARDIVAWLRSGEHDVLFAAEASPGTADIRWVEIAEQEQRVILTSDKDFGELVFREGLTSHHYSTQNNRAESRTPSRKRRAIHGRYVWTTPAASSKRPGKNSRFLALSHTGLREDSGMNRPGVFGH